MTANDIFHNIRVIVGLHWHCCKSCILKVHGEKSYKSGGEEEEKKND